MDEQNTLPELLSHAYDSLRSVEIDAAAGFLDRALLLDYEHEETLFALKCAGYWKERSSRLRSIQGPMERGDYILAQWKGFSGFIARLGTDFEPARYAFRRYIFGLALREYLAVPDEDREHASFDFEFRLGRCRKFSGDYDTATQHLETAARSKRDSAPILAELADAYSLKGEMRLSKALFREAFFLNPETIDLTFLESETITRLVAKVLEQNIDNSLVAEWIPVYGTIHGIFSVKRELKQSEASKLRQSVMELEHRMRDIPSEAARLTPRLLNKYFWLLDHFAMSGEPRARSDEVLLKIRLLDPAIHKLYTA